MPPASAASAVNSNSAANAAAAKQEREERLKNALKQFIRKERQRKKEEFEAKVEEERLRKEREDRERQNDMTLEETRGQIAKIEEKLKDLHNQKQQLFLQLKKVVNEDENRKKQQKDSEILAMQTLQAQANSIPQPQVFMPSVRGQHHQMPKPCPNQPVKRQRTPSPPPHPTYYKAASYAQPKHDDGRRTTDYARILWNKPHTQYQSPGTLFYQTTSTAPPTQPTLEPRPPTIIYPYNLPLRQGYHLDLQPAHAKTDPQAQKPPAQVYHINLDQPPISQAGPVGSGKPQVTMEKINDRYHVEMKHDPPPQHQLPEGVVYTNLIPNMPNVLHQNVLQIASASVQSSKPSSAGINYARSSVHDQLARQQQMPGMQNQPGQQPPQQPMHYRRPY